ncbi:hypothetical protein SAY86_024312 [Trapa natans]|uniref:Uncharacterized protein n=1 Tax=Trapa natans TaxID=22666 RepID=A0AAN7RDC2_TRANT|nr:hypothetical protein SAY86_024312 [Trapa natans]
MITFTSISVNLLVVSRVWFSNVARTFFLSSRLLWMRMIHSDQHYNGLYPPETALKYTAIPDASNGTEPSRARRDVAFSSLQFKWHREVTNNAEQRKGTAASASVADISPHSHSPICLLTAVEV